MSWLASLGLAQYADAFAQNDIERAHLSDLDQETLEAIA
jgi:hypothetical protein